MAFKKGHPRYGGIRRGQTHTVTDRAKTAALDMLRHFDESGLIEQDIRMLLPVERVNAYIRLLALVTPKDVGVTLNQAGAITIEERLASLSIIPADDSV